MRTVVYSLVVSSTLGLFAAAAALSAEKDETAAELAKLEGTYIPVSMESNGSPVPAQRVEAMKKMKLTISGSTLKIATEGKPKVREQKISIDPLKMPKHIDIIRTLGDKSTRTAVGIYSLEGKTLKICTDDSGKNRPTEFSSEGGTMMQLLVLEKQ